MAMERMRPKGLVVTGGKGPSRVRSKVNVCMVAVEDNGLAVDPAMIFVVDSNVVIVPIDDDAIRSVFMMTTSDAFIVPPVDARSGPGIAALGEHVPHRDPLRAHP